MYYPLFLIFLCVTYLLPAQELKIMPVSSGGDTIFADTLPKQMNGAAITFVQTRHVIAKAVEGSKLTFDFKFTNTGNEPLLVSNVRTSCHCTVASYPTTPVLPGSSENISLELDTKMLGQFTKVVAVYSNAVNLPRAILHIRWTVVPKPKDAEVDQPGDAKIE